VTYLFTGAFGQIIVLIAAMMLFLPLPLLPSQIIWLNFVTDTLMVVALASERHKSNLMNSSYVHPHSIMTAKMVKRVVTLAVPMAVGTIVVYWFYVHQDSRLSSSMALTTLAALHWATAWNARSERRSLFEKGAFLSNKLLVLMTAVGIAIQMGALYLPFMQTLLHTVPLGAKDFLVVGLVVVLYIGYEELRKAWVRLRFGSE
ncbi:MAG: P-type superfamily ATPase, partial [Patescibacteria group bacterium]|nr:P-type superfamily ATPase [Patescibacteria group bacterium]